MNFASVENHDYELYLAINDIEHTKTKVKHPQTNGICECFRKTILQEFYQVAFRKKIYTDLATLQADLDEWLMYYNHHRTHQGKMAVAEHRWQHYLMEKGFGQKRI